MGWRTGLALGDGGNGNGSMDEAEAAMGMGWMIEGVESSWGVYGRERAGSGVRASRRGRDRDRDRGEEGDVSGESYSCSSGVRLLYRLVAAPGWLGCSGLRRKGVARIGTEGTGAIGPISGVRRLEKMFGYVNEMKIRRARVNALRYTTRA